MSAREVKTLFVDLAEAGEDGWRVGPVDDPDRYGLHERHSRGNEGDLWRASLTLDDLSDDVLVDLLQEMPGPFRGHAFHLLSENRRKAARETRARRARRPCPRGPEHRPHRP
jgi:hypothetical protein